MLRDWKFSAERNTSTSRTAQILGCNQWLIDSHVKRENVLILNFNILVKGSLC